MDVSDSMPVGKIPPSVLSRILQSDLPADVDVLLPPRLGEDAAAVRFRGPLVVIGTDPITFPTPRPGFFAVHINANDLAVTGARPRFFTLTVLLPPGSGRRALVALVADARAAGAALGATLIGGHTEVTPAVRDVVVSVTMFGELIGTAPVCTGGGRPGDWIIQVGPMGIEGTAILATGNRGRLAATLAADLLERAVRFCDDPGISVVAPAALLAATLPVHAMHDPTEGGLATGMREICEASGVGCRLLRRELLIAPETRAICRALGVDPLGLISSGALLACVAPEHGADVCAALTAAGHVNAVIGELTGGGAACELVEDDGRVAALPEFAVDELATLAAAAPR